MKQCTDIYQEPIIMKMPGCTAKIYRPILSDEERAKRMKAIEKAAAKVLIEAMKGEAKRASRKEVRNES